MPVKVYEYAKCSTCRNALKWLDAKKVDTKIIPIVDEPPSAAELKGYIKASGLPVTKFFNTSGLVYREMKLGEKLRTMSEDEMIKLLASNGKLIKRPLLVDGKDVLVGFSDAAYLAHFKK